MSNRFSTAAVPRPGRALQQRNNRVTRYRDLVLPIAIHYGRRCPEPLEDLVQVGLLGLLRAAELYQASLATPFEAFARPHVRGAILHYLRDTAPLVRLPRRQMELQDRIRQLRQQWIASHGIEASDAQLRAALKLTAKQWQELVRGQALSRPAVLDPDDLDGRFQTMDGRDGNAVPEADRAPLELLDRLEPGLQQVVRKVVLAGWSYRRTAALLQISPMTVQRRLQRGLKLLQQGLLLGGDRAVPGSSARLSRCRRPHHAASVAPAC